MMPDYNINWYIEGHVLYVQAPPQITMETIGIFNERILSFLNTAENRVHLIVDARAIETMPRNPVAMRETLTILNHFFIGWMVFVTEDKGIQFLTSVIANMLSRAKSHSVADFSEAVAFLKEIEHTIDWQDANQSILAC
jgi:hypothetical protein